MYECDHCEFETDSEKGLKIHTSQQHKPSQLKEYECERCGELFEDYPSRMETRGRETFFCSRDCKDTYQEKEKFEFDCAWCGDKTEKYPSSVPDGRDKNYFCDKECESAWKQVNLVGEDHPCYSGGNDQVTCEECGDTYEATPAISDESKYCSRSCSNDAQSVETVEVTCTVCDDTIERKPYNIKTDTPVCSNECFSERLSESRRKDGNPQWKGGRPEYYGANWNAERRTALEQAEFECELCGMSRARHYDETGRDLDVHHRIPIRCYDVPERANFQANLVVCCRDCHQTKLEASPVPHSDVRAPADAAQ